MKFDKKKGSTILSAIFLLTIVVSFSMLLFALVASSSLLNKYQDNIVQKSIITSKIHRDFVQDSTIDDTYDYLIDVIENDSNTNQKAVVVYKTNVRSINNIYYYCIYDFAENKVIAEQSDNFYITNISGDFYLANIVKIL